MNSKKQLLTAWLPVLIWMAVIFYFSAQPGEESGQLSGQIKELIENFLRIFLSGDTVNLISEFLHTLVRKSAHFMEYLVLGVFMYRAIHLSRLGGSKGIPISVLICALYAISDEIHQMFVPGRVNQIKDVLIDSSGALIGVLICYFIVMRKIKKQSGE